MYLSSCNLLSLHFLFVSMMTTINLLTIVQVCIFLTTSISSISGTKMLDVRDDGSHQMEVRIFFEKYWILLNPSSIRDDGSPAPVCRSELDPGILVDLRLEPDFEHGIMKKLKRSSNDDFGGQSTNGIVPTQWLEPNFEQGIMRKLKRSSLDFEEQYTKLMPMLHEIMSSLKPSAEPLRKLRESSNNDFEEPTNDQGIMRSLKRSASGGPSTHDQGIMRSLKRSASGGPSTHDQGIM